LTAGIAAGQSAFPRERKAGPLDSDYKPSSMLSLADARSIILDIFSTVHADVPFGEDLEYLAGELVRNVQLAGGAPK
jgi:hypothetical protein